MIWGRKALGSNLVLLLAVGFLIAPLAIIGKIPSASAASPEFIDGSGNTITQMDIQYVDTDNPVSLNVFAKDPSTTGSVPSITTGNLPSGAELRMPSPGSIPLGAEGTQLFWDSSVFSVWDQSSFPISFTVNFTATNVEGSAYLLVTFVLFKNQVPTPIITFDKDLYLSGDKAYIAIYDPRANKDGYNVATERPLESIQITAGGILISATEVDASVDSFAKSGTFRATVDVASPPPSKLSIEYTTTYSGTVMADTKVSKYGVEFVKTMGTVGDTVDAFVVTPEGVTLDELKINDKKVTALPALTPGGRTKIDVKLPDTAGIVTLETNTKLAGKSLKNITTISVENTKVEFYDTSSMNPKSSYFSNETASVKVTAYHQNANHTKVETVLGFAKVYSTEMNVADRIPVNLTETGVDTGVFFANALIAFTTEDPDLAAELVKVKSPVNDITTITIEYNDGAHSDTKTATVTTAAASGIGSGSGNPNPASSIISITNLNCASYGGDTEKDDICNNWEAPTKTYLTIPYGSQNFVFSYACDPTCPHSSNKDILLEIDTINSGGPTSTVLPDIKGFFDSKGYKLHYQIDENVNVGADNLLNVWTDPTTDTGLCGDSFKEIMQKNFGKATGGERLTATTDCSTPTQVNNKGAAKKQVWNYCLYGSATRQQWAGPVGTSGLSELIGNNCIVTLGDLQFSPLNADKEKGTLMHEIGHMLGLNHGGGTISTSPLTWLADSNVNCKPNYISPMSYSHQFPNALGSVTLQFWTPSYSNDIMNPSSYDTKDPVNVSPQLNELNGPKPSSSGTADIAWHTATGPNNKPIAFGATGAADDVDWNGVGGITGAIWAQDFVNFGFPGCDAANITNIPSNGVIRGFNDWSNLILQTRVHGSSNWNVPGFSGLSNELDGQTWSKIKEEGPRTIVTKILPLTPNDFVNSTNTNQTKAELVVALVGGSSNQTQNIPVLAHFGQQNVVGMIHAGNTTGALQILYNLYTLFDGNRPGGNPNDDLLVNGTAKDSILDSIIGNIVANVPEQTGANFGLYGTNYHNYRLVIAAESSDHVRASGHDFAHTKDAVNSSKNRISFNVIGEGNVTFQFQRGLDTNKWTNANTIVSLDGIPVSVNFIDPKDGPFFGPSFEIDIPSQVPGGQIHSIVIEGAQVIPEFSEISILISAVTMMSLIVIILAISRRNHGALPAFFRGQ